MSIYWIGEEISTSGMYPQALEDQNELFVRVAEPATPNLYKFISRFGQVVYISDYYTIGSIRELVREKDYKGLYTFLYELLIGQIGMIEFLHSIHLHTAQERSSSYSEGRQRAQKDIREALGLEED
ncbi:hypothetical protein BigBertha_243 [Bacillus phage BigBertha]|uniref:Uncharacterized protein n=5 Tax=Caudoviricetes TaxID=2731619 RepID=A0A7U3T9C6_9CAUD|nr:hypothetical protein TROLL_246 [Bacillus phage Troll]YP_008771270.1 hypothetical protein BigBertha_243 [Bacillus phage BigBertha]YP_009206605.1 hypothetical protein AVV02_gp250 [Bacillus phage AvesoBmore]QPY77474.1 hypothetical protein ANTHOS_238 [Bacillus phage Anthos]AGT13594.1 hypothetical protein TROLL_246 [Bacillus phage Troll]AGY46751.1 hypothetical protein BigBertha_243 [Bacillus phage BigBertha]ALA13405.1 hypothetical protein AVESOBMORE_250 [Bacillus phage AvesoBmore]